MKVQIAVHTNSLPLWMFSQIGVRMNKPLKSPVGHPSIGMTLWVIKIKVNNDNY